MDDVGLLAGVEADDGQQGEQFSEGIDTAPAPVDVDDAEALRAEAFAVSIDVQSHDDFVAGGFGGASQRQAMRPEGPVLCLKEKELALHAGESVPRRSSAYSRIVGFQSSPARMRGPTAFNTSSSRSNMSCPVMKLCG